AIAQRFVPDRVRSVAANTQAQSECFETPHKTLRLYIPRDFRGRFREYAGRSQARSGVCARDTRDKMNPLQSVPATPLVRGRVRIGRSGSAATPCRAGRI